MSNTQTAAGVVPSRAGGTHPCDPHTLVGVCAGDCGRPMHRRRLGDPHRPCEDGHPTAEAGIRARRPLCSTCRRKHENRTLAVDPPTMPATSAPVGSRWREHAACRDHDPELFFPIATHGPTNVAQVAAAKAVCHSCPVTLDCLTEALTRIPDGIAGGLTADERRSLARRRTA